MKNKKIIDHIVHWLTDYLDTSGLNGFIIGVSGGIDSAVTSTLCARTGRPVKVLDMPIHQARDQVFLSSAHILWLENNFKNVSATTLELTPVFEAMKTCFPDHIQDDLTMANTRSRLRMLTLYAFASSQKLLVTGTGNKVEDFGVGFYTKYGDGGVDLSPIADLMKSRVYALGRELGIIDGILTAAPTDGLWADDRTDESQIGATYAELEWAMHYLEQEEETPLTERQEKVISIYKNFHTANQHKMAPIPVCCIPEALKD